MNQPIATRNHPSYWAFMVHRLSGLALACFLPIHLYVISLAIEGEANLDRFLHWADATPVKIAETLLVLLLASHMAGGLRLLAVEFLPWHEKLMCYTILKPVPVSNFAASLYPQRFSLIERYAL